LPVGREVDVPRRPGGADPGVSRSRDHRNGPDERAIPLIDIDPIVGAIACVYETVVPDHHAVWMAAAARCELTKAGTDAAHLAKVAAAPVGHYHAMVAVSIRDVHAAAFSRYGVRVWIHGDVRRTMQQGLAAAF